MSDLFDDFPNIVPGHIGWGTLIKIAEWEKSKGIGRVSVETIRAYREEGYGAAQAGLELGLIDYPQATGCDDE